MTAKANMLWCVPQTLQIHETHCVFQAVWHPLKLDFAVAWCMWFFMMKTGADSAQPATVANAITSMRCPVQQSTKGLLSVKTNHKPAGSSLSKQHLRRNSKHNASSSRDCCKPFCNYSFLNLNLSFSVSSAPQIRLFGPFWWHLQGAACLLECLLQAPSQKTVLHRGRERLAWDHYNVRYGLQNSRQHTFEDVKTALHFKTHPFHGKHSSSKMREA